MDLYQNKSREKWITHYSSSQMILLVGEGDFSFSASLARAFGSAKNMVATSLDSESELKKKHWTSVPHVKEVRKLGGKVLHAVDVNTMDQHHVLKWYSKFDRIIYNFPHAGHEHGLCERDEDLIKHKELLAAFFRSARQMVAKDGEIHVAHRNDQPYKRWELEKLAKEEGLILKERTQFSKADYPGYHNKRGGSIKSNKTFPLKDHSFTFKFSLSGR